MQSAVHWFASGFAFHWPAPEFVVHRLSPELVLYWVALALVLLVTLAVGVGVHELLHLVPLHLADAGYTVTVLPDADSTPDASSTTAGSPPPAWTALRNALTGGLVRVEVTHVPAATPEWVLRGAAIAPVALALPLLLVAAGLLPNPVAAGDYVGTVALVAVSACGLPSPADWSVVWYGSDLADGD